MSAIAGNSVDDVVPEAEWSCPLVHTRLWLVEVPPCMRFCTVNTSRQWTQIRQICLPSRATFLIWDRMVQVARG